MVSLPLVIMSPNTGKMTWKKLQKRWHYHLGQILDYSLGPDLDVIHKVHTVDHTVFYKCF